MESNPLLWAYAQLHRRPFDAWRIEFPGASGVCARAHLSIPRAGESGPGPQPQRLPLVVVFPILAGSHVVSEGVARVLVQRGYAVVRLERQPLDLATSRDPQIVSDTLGETLADARRLVGWLATQPRIDAHRVAAAGVSLGGIMAASLVGMDPRVSAGFFVMAGGGLAEILYDSREHPLERFRDRILDSEKLATRAAFLERMRPLTLPVDPLSFAAPIDPARVLLVSGRFDRVIPPARSRALWQALRRPHWIRLPVGHYQLLPFFFWAINRGADHLDRVFQTHQARAA